MRNRMFDPPLNTNRLNKAEIKDMPEWFTPVLDFVNKISQAVYYAQDYDITTLINETENRNQIFIAYEQFASGVDAGNSVAGVWQPRALNTVQFSDIEGTQLANNRIKLPIGDYLVIARANTHGNVGNHRTRIQKVNATNSTLLFGSPGSSTNNAKIAWMIGSVSISKDDILELQHRCDNSVTNGFGTAISDGFPEIYSSVYFRKRF